jgi:hypothetical protein
MAGSDSDNKLKSFCIKNRVPLALYLIFQVLYFAFTFKNYPIMGDAADYGSLVLNHTFNLRTTHIGYYLVYYLFGEINEFAIHLPYDYFSNLLTALWGALTIPILYFIINNLISAETPRKNYLAVYGTVTYGLAGLVWYNFEFAEVQALWLLLLFLSFLVFLQRGYWLSGILLAGSALVSQACAPSIVLFIAIAITRKIRVVKLVEFFAAFSVTLVLGILPVYHDFLWGPRGVFTVYATSNYQPINPIKLFLSLGDTFAESFWLLSIFFILSIKYILKQKDILWISLLSLVSCVYLGRRLAQSEYGFIWLPLFFIVALWIPFGLDYVLSKLPTKYMKAAAAFVGIAFLILTLTTYILPKKNAAESNPVCLKAMHEFASSDTILTTAFVGFAYAHENNPRIADVWNYPWMMPPPNAKDYECYRDRTNVYLLDYAYQSYFLRKTLLDNLITRRYLSESRIKQYVADGDYAADDIKEIIDCKLDTVLQCGDFFLYRLNMIDH